jgi:NDP-hexose C3-ketoreductase / dTDP-4-oxo-2-deoxy-alpha-D-pentos-2-ene 2,3-reductase
LAHFVSLSDELGQSPGAIALAWTLHQNGIAATIVGPRNREQLVSIANVPELMLSAEVLTRLDAIFPPCGPAPEAYAW